MTARRIFARRRGNPEVLEAVERIRPEPNTPEPMSGEERGHILAAGISHADLDLRQIQPSWMVIEGSRLASMFFDFGLESKLMTAKLRSAKNILSMCILARTVAALLIATFLVFSHALEVAAQTVPADHDDVSLTGSHTDVQFLAGRKVTIQANVSDDVFAAGRDVTFDSATVNNAVVAGYDVEQRGGTMSDFAAVAANLKISGTIKDDLVAGARTIRIANEASVRGDVRVAAETIEMEGQVDGSVRAVAQRITISGKVSGKVDLLAKRIVIERGAVIAGDLIYRGKEKPEIAEGATISGQVRQLPIEMPDLRAIGWKVLGIGLLIGASWAVATLLLVIAVHWAFPHFMANTANSLLTHPWSNLGRGIAIGLIASALAGVFFASILAIPLGSALFMAMGIAWLLGLAAVSAGIGILVRNWRSGKGAEIAAGSQTRWAVLGALILALVMLVPVVGWLVAGLAIAAGLGAATAELWQRLRQA